MSDEIDPPAFEEYDVPEIGTVLDPLGDAGYRVRLLDGRVIGVPAASGTASQANAPTDIAAALASPPQPPPPQAQIYDQQQALGYVDTATGLKLKTTEYAQAKFTSQVALVRLALSAGAIDDSTAQNFWDFDNAEQTLSTADFLALMLRYGLHCKTLFDTFAP
ncbi:MAG TPA: hypothetical protein VHD61_15765 [Lacunisphaera sp.]|nr:hypothetical protein [Lacunisphaera sp.]